MRKAIATVSMSGTLREKLEAIAAARFDGFELFEPDLINFNGTPAEVGAIARTAERVYGSFQSAQRVQAERRTRCR